MLSLEGCSFVETKANMLIRTHPYMTVLYSTREATLSDLPSFAGTVVRDLYRYVADLDLLVCGPQYWFYYVVDGKPQTRFTLEVALPVHWWKIPTAVLPHFKRIPAFRCLSSRAYEGPSGEGIAEEYQRMCCCLMLSDNGLKMNGILRAESFLHIDFDDPAQTRSPRYRSGFLNGKNTYQSMKNKTCAAFLFEGFIDHQVSPLPWLVLNRGGTHVLETFFGPRTNGDLRQRSADHAPCQP